MSALHLQKSKLEMQNFNLTTAGWQTLTKRRKAGYSNFHNGGSKWKFATWPAIRAFMLGEFDYIS